jgi:hypothetical protein
MSAGLVVCFANQPYSSKSKMLSPGITFTVTNANSVGAGSLWQAIADANASPGVDVINFNIGSGPQTIISFGLPTITEPVIIDGTTQPEFSGAPLIELNGNGSNVEGLKITSGGCTVQGLVINRYAVGIRLMTGGNNIIRGNFIGTDMSGTVSLANGNGLQIESSNQNIIGGANISSRNIISGNHGIGVNLFRSNLNQVLGNYIGTDVTGTAVLPNLNQGVGVTESSNNIIGGSTPEERNVISGNNSVGVGVSGSSLRDATGNTVSGNYIGINASGTAALPNRGDGVYVLTATNNTVGGGTPGARNIISGNPGGVKVTGGTGNIIKGNFIGTDPTGTSAIPNPGGGINIISASYTIIGGKTPGDRNVISGNGQRGVWIYDSLGGTGNQVMGNYIGTQANGVSPLGNAMQGVYLNNSAGGNTIGGIDAGAGNVIAFNGDAGVGNDVRSGGMFNLVGNSILANNIFSNAGLGIDLLSDGVSPNDPGDTVNNNVQNFPVLATAQVVSGGTRITGNLNSQPNSNFRIEFFSNTTCDPSGNGEGQRPVGATTVTTDSNGDAHIDTTVAPNDTAGSFITGTATNTNSSSSEFSACVKTADPAPPPPPVLLSEPNSTRAIAMDSVIMLRDPFPVITTNVLSPDHRTRLSLFALNVDLQLFGNMTLTAQVEDSNGVHSLPIEYSGSVPGYNWLTQIVVKLPDELSQNGDVNVSISFKGQASNKVLVGIRAP